MDPRSNLCAAQRAAADSERCAASLRCPAQPGHGPEEQCLKFLSSRLLAAGISTSVQTTVVAGAEWVMDWVADYCLAARVRQLSILPFIPRGSGYLTQGKYGLTTAQRAQLRESVRQKRRLLNGRLDVRWLDFSARPLHVVEADGRLVLEGASESMDTLVCTLPADPAARKRVAIQAVVR